LAQFIDKKPRFVANLVFLKVVGSFFRPAAKEKWFLLLFVFIGKGFERSFNQ